MTWNPKTYLAFADERTRPAAELLARVTIENPSRVTDLGCGPGNSTALLVERWPQAEITGIDSSPEMIATAKASGVRAQWELADLASWVPQKSFDVIFSNATYQWLADHQTLLPCLMAFTAKCGVFAFQVPNNMNAPSHLLMREAAEDGPWAAKLKNVRAVSVESAERYFDILAPHAVSLDIWETEYLQVLEGDDPVYKWVSGTGLRPFVQSLDGSEREDFIAQYKARLRIAYPKRADGKTMFPFRRLFAIAQIS
jgi:trans-aconitate 2-methyltransferase